MATTKTIYLAHENYLNVNSDTYKIGKFNQQLLICMN